MNYYNILNLKKEPFSNSPEPEFLFQLPLYSSCLQKLELAVRLRRGINVVIGDIGTGKTTLCRKLIQSLSSDSADSTRIETHLMLDPAFHNSVEFLQTVASMLGIRDLNENQSEWHLKERIKDYLFEKGVDERRIVVLIIDEGQKIPENCLEILREFLNYETNKFKLLQIIIFAQKEFEAVLKKKANLLDRINLLYYLKPLNFTQMRAMIDYRLSVAREFATAPTLFSMPGFAAVYLATGGYPRKAVFLCHQVILKMIVRGKKKAGWFLVRSCINEMATPVFRKLRWALAGMLALILTVSAASVILQLQEADAYKKTAVISTSAPRISVPSAAPPPVSANVPVNQTGTVITPPVVSPDNVQEIKMPGHIGKLPMTKRRTIWWTLNNVYGDINPDIMNAVFAANPHIKNKDIVNEGTVIILPSLPAGHKPVQEGESLIALKSGKDLETMYNIFRNNPEWRKIPPLAFLSFWNKKDGMEFAIVIDKSFRDDKSAGDALGKLPKAVAPEARILSRWEADTVFFNRRVFQH